jgi:hypothetical protein
MTTATEVSDSLQCVDSMSGVEILSLRVKGDPIRQHLPSPDLPCFVFWESLADPLQTAKLSLGFFIAKKTAAAKRRSAPCVQEVVSND